MAVTQQLAVLPFADGTQATVSQVLDVAGGTIQSLVYTVPVGHQVTVRVADDADPPNVLWTRTVVGNGPPQTIAVGVPLSPKQPVPYQMAFWGS